MKDDSMKDEGYEVIVTAPFWPEVKDFNEEAAIKAAEVGTYQHILYED